MFFWKKNLETSYKEVLRFFKEYEQEIEIIHDLEQQHKDYLLDEKVKNMNGFVAAISKFYYDDVKEQLLYLKNCISEEERNAIEDRIHIDKVFICELEKFIPISAKLRFNICKKSELEKKLRI